MTQPSTLHSLPVLTVEPPPNVSRYSHRNGERTPPTELGDFGFSGVVDAGQSSEFAKKGILSIHQFRDGSGMYIPLLEDEQRYPEHCSWPNQCEGQWWGPITGAWQVTP